MAGYNEIQVGRFNRFIQKLLSMKGPASMNELSSTLQLIHPVFHGAENRFIEGWNRYGVWLNAPAVALQFSAGRLRMRNKSNVIAVIEKILVSPATTGTIELQYGQPNLDLATPQVGRSIDGRNIGNPVCIASFGSAAGGAQIGTTIEAMNDLANVAFDLIATDNQEIVLASGDAAAAAGIADCVAVQLDLANTAVSISFIWRERFLEDSERS